MKDISSGNEEMTGLTEHLRRQTGQLHRRSPRILVTKIDPVVARQKLSQKQAKIDRFFLVLFPLLFLLFNCVYWAAYYYAHPVIQVEAEQIS